MAKAKERYAYFVGGSFAARAKAEVGKSTIQRPDGQAFSSGVGETGNGSEVEGERMEQGAATNY